MKQQASNGAKKHAAATKRAEPPIITTILYLHTGFADSLNSAISLNKGCSLTQNLFLYLPSKQNQSRKKNNVVSPSNRMPQILKATKNYVLVLTLSGDRQKNSSICSKKN